ncbi:hypothetical protein NPIL_45571 [Nephila pilipes]|uniref:Uncharacterized protein n=1 Tax=Nephila pilipes TaxID=299642 RepID=A0A8X6P360_NEPPI|nr:hypothetical protein NPIL_45571 [Nephila pilipes]
MKVAGGRSLSAGREKKFPLALVGNHRSPANERKKPRSKMLNRRWKRKAPFRRIKQSQKDESTRINAEFLEIRLEAICAEWQEWGKQGGKRECDLRKLELDSETWDDITLFLLTCQKR